MQSPSIPATSPSLPGNIGGAPVAADATMNTLGTGDFNRALTRELSGKEHEHKHEHKSAAKGQDTAATVPPIAAEVLALPPDQNPAATALLALTSEIQVGDIIPDYLQQISGEIAPVALPSQVADDTLSAVLPTVPSSQVADDALATALSSQIANGAPPTASNPAVEMPTATPINQPTSETLLAALSDQATGASPVTVPSSQTTQEPLLAASSSPIPGGIPQAAASNPASGGIAIASLQTGVSAQRNSPQNTQHSIKSVAGIDSATPESDETANFAASDKILPRIAADDKVSRAMMQLSTQDTSGTASQPQMGTSPTATAATSLIPNSFNIDHNQTPRIEARVGTPAWDGALSQRVVWMVTQQQQVAQLQLNPPNLGPMEVMLTVGTGPDPQTRIEFTSPHLAVREAIQAALPHLRELMADNGISLGSATVSADSFQQQAQAGRHEHSSPKQVENMLRTGSELAVHSATTRVHTGMVDTFA